MNSPAIQEIAPKTKKEKFAFPASYAQERLWLLEQIQAGDPAYHIAGAVRFRGRLNISALHEALSEILRRQESLRTTFQLVDGKLMQVVSSAGELPFESVSALAAEEELLEQLSLLSRKPFNLQAGPLLRTVLLEGNGDDHTLLLVIHHIVADGWSLMVMIRELMDLYRLFTGGAASQLQPLPIQYADYTLWQQKWISSGNLDGAIQYWNEKLSNAPVTTLPTDYMRPAIQKHGGARETVVLSKNLTASIVQLSQKAQSTLFMVLLAAFKILVYRHTGADEIVIGTPVAGRKRVELERLIGCFLNTLVLRTKISSDASFLQTLQEVKAVTLEAYSHEDLPYERVLAEVQSGRPVQDRTLFRILFNMLNFPDALEIALPDVQASMIELPEHSSKFDLTLYLTHTSDGIHLSLVYDNELFRPERIKEILRQYEFLLAQIVEQPEQTISMFSLLTSEAKLLVPDPASPLDASFNGAVHQIFRAQAERSPEQVAIADPHVTWTYQQLDCLSNKIANALLHCGTKSGTVVAIYAYRSAPVVAALLGIMKSGASFLILDPAYPQARLVDYLRLSEAKALVHLRDAGSLPDQLEKFVLESSCTVISLDESGKTEYSKVLENAPDTLPEIPISSEDLAYITFTSGSTGYPKGVLGKHGSLSHFAPWLAETFGLNQADRFSMLSGLAHDPLHRDIFLPLMTGASIFVPDADEWKLPGQALQWIREKQISVMNLTPATAQMILSDASASQILSSLRHIFFIGDVLTRHDIAAFQKLSPQLTCVNFYGATETQQALSFHIWRSPEIQTHASAQVKDVVPLGRGFKDVQLLVINRAGNMCGIGEPGEIYFRSPHLSPGYLNDSQLTREKFFKNWFSSESSGDRLYRSGDLGRYLPDGSVEPLGRTDQQVKIRGFRVEPKEIEATIRMHPGVRSALVTARDDESGQRQLVAYVVNEEETQDWEAELFHFLGERLPSYMMPSALVQLKAIPLLPNGKVDRSALPAPNFSQAQPSSDQVFVREDEEILCGIFAEVLKRERVHRSENFFESGGHSLLTVQVVARIQKFFGADLPLRAIFDAPTPAALAKQIRAARGNHASVVPVSRANRDQLLPLSFAQQRLWFLERLQPGGTAYNMLSGIRLCGELNSEALKRSLHLIVERHEILRTTFPEQNGVPQQRIAHKGKLHIEEFDLRELAIEDREGQILKLRKLEAEEPFHLSTGPLLRIKLIQLAVEEHVLLMNMHHIIGDAWSTGVIIQEFSQLYLGECTGQPVSLAPLEIQYADYAVWQRNWLQGQVLERQLSYWRKQLAGVSPLELPLDFPRPAVMKDEGATLSVHLRPELIQELRKLSQHEGVTLFMMLLSAWQLLMSRSSGQLDTTVGAPIAGRTRPETAPLIGFFVNTLVLRTQIRRDSTFRTLLAGVRETTLEAYEHQDVPFEKLVEELQPPRDLSRQPFFQVMFGLQNATQQELKLPGLQITPLDRGSDLPRVKFDLTLLVHESPAGLEGRLEYATALFERQTVERMVQRWEILLQQAVKAITQSVARMPLVTEAERETLVHGWSGPAAMEITARSIGELITRNAERDPEAVALRSAGRELTYGMLERQANQWANALIGLGITPGSHVVVCLNDPADLIVISLGILKSGGVLAGLDPDEPIARIEAALAECDVALAVTTRQLASKLSFVSARVISLEEFSAHIARQSDLPASVAVAPEAPACVFYRSRSGGKVTRVTLSHCSLWGSVFSSEPDKMAIRALDRVAMALDFSQETTSVEVFRVLACGACILSLSDRSLLAPRKLAGFLRDEKCTVLWASAATIERMAREFPWSLKTVKYILCEEPFAVLTVLQKTVKTEILERIYGVVGHTECTGRWWVFPLASMRVPGRIRPDLLTAGTTMHLLDSENEPVPDGILGEICLADETIACTDERTSISASSSFCSATQIYRTGDWAWRHSDGTLQYCGRKDGQIVILGFRIAAEEIEAVLAGNDRIEDAVVLVSASPEKMESVLTAMFVARAEHTISAEELRANLEEKLPRFMVPRNFVQIKAVPRDGNGHIDRAAATRMLAAHNAGTLAPDYVAPRNQIEEQLAQIWGETFSSTKVGIHDSFFQLGGHSLQATQVVARINDALGIELPLRKLFEFPTVAELARVIAPMIAEGKTENPATIAPAPRDQAVPLSFAQQRLWFLHQLAPESAAYNLRIGIRLMGAVDHEAINWSLQEIVNRHESLRTSFAAPDGHAVQIIAQELKLQVQELDVPGHTAEEREAELERMAREEAATPFDLSRAPLLRLKLLRLHEKENVLLVTMHHIVSDGLSMEILVREFSRLYAAHLRGERPVLPELPIQYADYTVWQRAWLQGEVLQQQLEFWRKQLAGVPVVELPTDRPRPAMMSQRGASIRTRINEDLVAGLNRFSQKEGVTLFMTLLAAWQILLSRYSGQRDIAIGTPIAGRTRRETEHVIGCFINTLVLRTEIDDEETFRNLLRQVRERTLEAYQHQDVPFEKLVDELQPQRDLGRQPFFQVMFGLQNTGQEQFQLPGLQAELLQVEGEGITAKFDLMLLLDGSRDGLQAMLEYTPDLFDRVSVATMFQRWQVILEQIVERVEQPLASISLLRAAERQVLTDGWRRPAATTPVAQHIEALLDYHAEHHPHAMALIAAGSELSYELLNRQARQWANYLVKHGVTPGTNVGICLEQPADIVAVSLGVLKSGGILVAFGPESPRARVAAMLKDSRPLLVVADTRQAEKFSGNAARVIHIDEQRAEVMKEGDEPFSIDITLTNTACTLYRPDAEGRLGPIHVSHQMLCSGVLSEKTSNSERVAQLVDFERDVQGLEVFRTLMRGSCIISIPLRPPLAPRKYADLLRDKKVTVLWTSAAVLEKTAREFPWALKNVQRIICDDCIPALNWLQKALNSELLQRVYGVYGYSEAGGACMMYPLACLSGQRIALNSGYLTPGTGMFLLDGQLEPVPEHIAGEIYLASAPNPTAATTEASFKAIPPYRTGDMAWRHTDGSLEIRGRHDGRRLVEGVRVQLEEIEAILKQHPALQDAAIGLREVSGQPQVVLVGMLVDREEQAVSDEELINLLQSQLPEVMVPRSFIHINNVPRNKQGRVDRCDLARMLALQDAANAAPEYAVPRTDIEKLLVEIWQEVLNIEKIGIHDNFFKLGGDSILSIQVIARAKQAGVGLLPRQIFEKQTIAELAAVAGTVSATIEAEQGTVSGLAPLTPFQKIFFDWELAKPEHFNQSILLSVDVDADTLLLEQAISGLLEHHDALRMRYERRENGWQQICEAKMPRDVYERRDFATVAEVNLKEELQRHANRVQASLDPAAGRLIKAVEYDFGSGRGKRLLLVIHHLVIDGVSWRILIEDLERAYDQLAKGREIKLGPKTTSFKQWAERLHEYGSEDRVKKEVGYWTSESRKRAKRLPVDSYAGYKLNRFGTQKVVSTQLSEEETQALLQDVPGVYNTQINDVLLTALARVLTGWSGNEALLVELEGHGREEIFPDIDLSRTVGWFTSTYPVLLDTGNASKWDPGKALTNVKEQLRAVPNRGLGYGVLRHVTRDERIRQRLAEMPPAEIIFNYLGQIDQVLRKSALLAPAEEGSGVSIAAENRRQYVLDVMGIVVAGKLQVNWNYSEELHRRETIANISQKYLECLRELIAHCRSEDAGGYTASDFPVAEMTQEEFALLASLLEN